MKRPGLFIILFLFFLSVTTSVEAHSGRTDSNGGHNCNVGACAGTYHYHNGGPALPPVQIDTPVPTVYVPPPTTAPLRISTPIPTRLPTRVPTKKLTPTVTVVLTSTPTATLTPKPSEKINDVKIPDPNFWQKVFNFFFGN